MVDYTSALAAQGAASFTVGQAAGSGSYTTGSAGQTLDDESYYWRVKAIDESDAESAYSTANSGDVASQVDATAPSIPGTPSTTTPTADTTPTWTWDVSTDGGSGLHATEPYTVEWCQDSGFSGCSSNTSTASSASFTHTTALAEGTWYARVKAKDAVDNESAFSANGSVVINSDPSAPTGLSPADRESLTDTTPTLSFTLSDPDDSEQLKFQIQISQASDFSNLLIDYTSALGDEGSRSFTVGQDAGSGAYATGSSSSTLSASPNPYYWRVKAIDDLDAESSFVAASGEHAFSVTESTSGGGGGGGGASLPPQAFQPPTQPVGGFQVQAPSSAESPLVELTFLAGPDTTKMALSNSADFSSGSTGQIAFQPTYHWNLCEGRPSCVEGNTYTAYAKFYTQYGQASDTVSASILYAKEVPPSPPPFAEPTPPPPPPLIERIIPPIFRPAPAPEPEPEPVAPEEIPEEAPLVFQGQWQLIPSEPVRQFVLAPLPRELRALVQKFPELGETFEQVGVSSLKDLQRLQNTRLTLPGLVEFGQLHANIPTEVVFATGPAEVIDIPAVLTVNQQGEPQQQIRAIAGKPLNLTVKPDQPARSVKGYVVFKSKTPRESLLELPAEAFLGSAVFAQSQLAQASDLADIETRLVLLEFEYTGPDEQGLYTADIQAPVVEGEYEVLTVIEYEDEELGTRVLRLVTVVDPEGYVYEKSGDREIRIPGAIVSLYWLNPQSRAYELWPAKDYQQENPQITDITGKYSFLTPQGTYYLLVQAPGYPVYEGKAFEVKEGAGVHMNIEVKNNKWWLHIVDWRTILLAVVLLLLLLNFWRDKMREKGMRKSA